jgi:hypothetical protein
LNLLKHFRYTLFTYTPSVCLENVSKLSIRNTRAKKRGYFHVNFDSVRVTVTVIVVDMFVLRDYTPAKTEIYTQLVLAIPKKIYMLGYHLYLFAL